MNTRRSTAIWEEECLDNERITLSVDQLSIVSLEKENKEVPLQEHQVPPELLEPQMYPMTKAHLLRIYD